MGAEFAAIPKPTPVPASNGAGAASAAGSSPPSLPVKRKETENFDPRQTKAACNHGAAGGSVGNHGAAGGSAGNAFDESIRNVTHAFDSERRRFHDELRRKDFEHAEKIKKIQAEANAKVDKYMLDMGREGAKALDANRRLEELKKTHAAEMDKQSQSFETQLGQHKANSEASFRRQLDQLITEQGAEKKAFEARIAELTADKKALEARIAEHAAAYAALERTTRDMLAHNERQLDEREYKQRSCALADLRTAQDERLKAVQMKFDAELRAQLCEQRIPYERKIAELNGKLDALTKDFGLRKDLQEVAKAVPQLLEGVYSASSQLGVFKTQVSDVSAKTAEIHDQANRFQGFVTAMQTLSGGHRHLPGPQPMMYYPPQHPPPSRVRHGAFHTEAPAGQ